MAGHLTSIGGTPCFIDYPDGHGSATHSTTGRTIYWDFHNYCGPLFLRADGDTPLVRQPGEKHWVWPQFEAWLQAYRAENPVAEMAP
jgi:hypothetical protein